MRLVLTGAAGLLGSTFQIVARQQGHEVVPVHHRPGSTVDEGIACDLLDDDAPHRLVEAAPDWIVNCAALTDVDWCQSHPDETSEVNAALPARVAAAAAAADINVLHVSTDSVFDGRTGGYEEDDTPNPLNVYASAKLAGERDVLAASDTHLVVRTNMFGWSPKRRGLAEWILGTLRGGGTVPGFTDAFFAPLLTNHLSGVMLEAIGRGLRGLYHAGAPASTSKYEFARDLASRFALDPERVQPATMQGATFIAERPRNTSLVSRRLEQQLGHRLPSLADGVAELKALEDGPFLAQLGRQGDELSEET
jgi:dTDP-4-dehydrorhamnose reductase